MDGILLIDKPKGWTSFDVVAKTRGMAKQITGVKRFKVGHAGTLDPLATGLMIILLGKYTKRAGEFSKLDKVYEVTAKLGETSTTADDEGEKTYVSDKIPTDEEVKNALKQFTGAIEQVPPIYSAIKVDGKRAYELARKGKVVELKARPVMIHEITEVEYDYPVLKFTVNVSSGTYIRSLITDIGENLGTGAYTTDLRRTSVGKFNIAQAAQMGAITVETVADAILVQE
jgi:tRNA pseudouridine55 synthase